MSKAEMKTVLMDFSGIYEQENFYKGINCEWIDLQDLSGCNCYCDDEAKERIEEKIKDFSENGIHFIDSGNYHYMSRIWLGKIDQPFRLLVFDNHTDMQPPAFGGLLSCGGWFAAAVEELPYLEEVILVGPDEEAYGQVEEHIKKKTRFLSREILKKDKKSVLEFLENISADKPLYISVDKDVLCTEDASTTWSQGDMKLEEMLDYLRIVRNRFESVNQVIIGVDICGECDSDQMAGHVSESMKNNCANEALLNLFWKVFEK